MTGNPVRIPRQVRFAGSKGNRVTPPLPTGAPVRVGDVPGVVVSVRAKKKYARRYLVEAWGNGAVWLRRDQLEAEARKSPVEGA